MSDAAWAAIDPLLPRNRPGPQRVDDRHVIGGMLHMLRSGRRWQDCPAVYGSPTTIDNRWHRWSGRGLWLRLFEAVAAMVPADVAMIDSSAVKAHRASVGGHQSFPRRPHDQTPRHLRRQRPPADVPAQSGHVADITVAPGLLTAVAPSARFLADMSADADAFRNELTRRGSHAVLPNNPTRNGCTRLIQTHTGSATLSIAYTASSRTGAASPPDTTASHTTTPQPSPPSLHGLMESGASRLAATSKNGGR